MGIFHFSFFFFVKLKKEREEEKKEKSFILLEQALYPAQLSLLNIRSCLYFSINLSTACAQLMLSLARGRDSTAGGVQYPQQQHDKEWKPEKCTL